jgi:carbonic anhydrase/acetyltransferase-like protein (isoleucine patch superfamily)
LPHVQPVSKLKIRGRVQGFGVALSGAGFPSLHPLSKIKIVSAANQSYFCKMGSLDKQLDTFLRRQPKLGKNVFIAKNATVIGDVTLGAHASVWYGAVLRGDINRIVVGHHSNIQDNAVLHLADDFPCLLGNWVTVGHSAIVHACTVGDEVLVGMGAVILDGAVIGKQSLIGAKALVTQGTKIPPGSLVLGAPAKVVRKLTKEERAGLKWWAEKYVDNGAYCLKHGIGVGGPLTS